MIAHRLADPELVAARAGTAKRAERSHQLDHDGATGMGSLRIQETYRIDPNDLRNLPPGVAWITTAGRAAKVAIARARHAADPTRRSCGDQRPAQTSSVADLDTSEAELAAVVLERSDDVALIEARLMLTENPCGAEWEEPHRRAGSPAMTRSFEHQTLPEDEPTSAGGKREDVAAQDAPEEQPAVPEGPFDCALPPVSPYADGL